MKTYKVTTDDGRVFNNIYADSPFAAKRHVFSMLNGRIDMTSMTAVETI